MATINNPALPGRLGDLNMNLATDSRTNPKLIPAVTPFGMDKAIPNPKNAPEVGSAYDMSVLSAALEVQSGQFETFYEVMPNDLPGDDQEPEVTREVIKIPGPNDNEIALYVYKPKAASEPLPCIVYIHGGGMTLLSTTNKVHTRWTKSFAQAGCISIAIDFRNAWTSSGYNHFPCGLNDCAASIQYISTHKRQLGITTLTLQGESGGANLVLASALKAKRENWLHAISGVYAYVPFISGVYGSWSEERMRSQLPSLVENDGYVLNVRTMGASVAAYTPKREQQEDALAWPYFATVEEMRGLPPHVVVVDELDPLRDEGLAYYRRLLAAGVEVTGQVNLGIPHAAGLIFRKAMPEVHRKVVREIVAFARSL